MNCRRFISFVNAKPLRERSDGEMQQVRRHAARCRSCEDYLESAIGLERDLGELPQIAPSKGFSSRVMDRAVRGLAIATGPTPTPRTETVSWAAALIGIAALVGGLVYMLRPETWIEGLFSLPNGIIAFADAFAHRVEPQTWPERMLSLPSSAAATASGFLQHIRPEQRTASLISLPGGIDIGTMRQLLARAPSLNTLAALGGVALLAFLFWLYDDCFKRTRGSAPR